MMLNEQELIEFSRMFSNPWVALLLSVMIVWTIIWKGIALFKAAQNSQKIWFIVMLLANTVGILEIIYIFFFQKKKV